MWEKEREKIKRGERGEKKCGKKTIEKKRRKKLNENRNEMLQGLKNIMRREKKKEGKEKNVRKREWRDENITKT